MDKPKITYVDHKGWRVDFPDGDYVYQPSQDFAKAAARKWAEEHKCNAQQQSKN
jgi:hypothetical protein